MLTSASIARAIARMQAGIEPIRDELNAADRKLGDGDTGMTVAAIVKACNTAAESLGGDLGAALIQLGRETSRASGSSLGAVLATGLSAAGRSARGKESFDREGVIAMIAAATKTIMERSGANAGDKSVVDTLQRIERELAASPAGSDLLQTSIAAAQSALEDFRGREARLGRSRMYGTNSIGLDDPGMKALVLLLQAAAGAGPQA